MSEGPKPKYSATRRLHLKTKLLKRASTMLVEEVDDRKQERETSLTERVPPLKLSGLSVQELQALCKDLHRKSDIVDDIRYDMDVKVIKNDIEIQTLMQKVNGMKGGKRTNLKRVKKAGASVLSALNEGPKVTNTDFKLNLKTVKKVEEKKEEVTDWRKNVEAMSGMEGRKKLFQ